MSHQWILVVFLPKSAIRSAKICILLTNALTVLSEVGKGWYCFPTILQQLPQVVPSFFDPRDKTTQSSDLQLILKSMSPLASIWHLGGHLFTHLLSRSAGTAVSSSWINSNEKARQSPPRGDSIWATSFRIGAFARVSHVSILSFTGGNWRNYYWWVISRSLQM